MLGTNKKNLFLLVLFTVMSPLWALEITLNGYPPESGLERDNQAWHFSYERKFSDATGQDIWSKELGLARQGWKQHKEYPHIRGYNGNIDVKILAPGPVTHLTASAAITNFADSNRRQVSMSYSLNGFDYVSLAQQDFTGTAALEGNAELPANRGVLWLRLQRNLTADDSNGQHGFVLWSGLAFKLQGAYPENTPAQPEESKAAESVRLQDFFPTGVFWPWERTKANANFAGMELWAFVEQTMQTLHEHNCNTLWFVNIGPGEDARRLLALAEKHQLKVLLNTELVTFFYHGMQSLEQAAQLARNTVNKIGDSPALLGYVLKDEPLLCSVAQLSFLYRIMKKYDPLGRDSVAVVMNRQSQTYLEDSELPVICTDIYYFGHDHSTNIPNPASVSQKEFRIGVRSMNLIAEQRGKHSWLMPQMFGDVWGRHYRRGDKLVVEPGSYLHWRMPTLAETRWQIWEGLRLGSKGMIFYVLYPPIPLWTPPEQVATDSPESKRVANMDKLAGMARSWKRQRLTEVEMELDPGEGVLQPGGKPTPQMAPMGEAFRVIRKHADLLTGRKRADFPVFFAGDPETEVATFAVTGQPQVRYGVVVNSNLAEERAVQILLPPNVVRVTNLNQEVELPLQPADKGFLSTVLALAAGDGCLLRAEFRTEEPGVLFFRENFAQHDQHKVKFNPEAGEIVRLGNFGMYSSYGVKLRGDGSLPVFTVENLTNRKNAANTILMNVNSTREQGKVFCLLEGQPDGVRLFAVDNSVSGGEETNVMHLQDQNTGQKAQTKTEGKVTLLQDKDFFHPVLLPVGTTSLQVFMDSKKAHSLISNVTIWFVPD